MKDLDEIAHSRTNRSTRSRASTPGEKLVSQRPKPGMPPEGPAFTRSDLESRQRAPLTNGQKAHAKKEGSFGNRPGNIKCTKVIQYIRIPPAVLIVRPPPKILIACPKCRASILENFMDAHFASCHSPDEEATPLAVARRLPFVLLPPGTWSVEKVLQHYRNVERGSPATRRIVWSRIVDILSLNPTQWYTGRKSWTGYSVFEFAGTNRVVLECPIENNATYILSRDWRKMVCLTKAEIRKDFADCSRKMVGNTSKQIVKTLRKSLSSPVPKSVTDGDL